MIRNFLTITLRIFKRNILFSAINLFGLATGLAACIIITLYIRSENSFDNFHNDPGRLFNVIENIQSPTGGGRSAQFTAAVLPDFKEAFPSIESFCRISYRDKGYFDYNHKKIETMAMIYADSSFFEMFNFKLVQGDPRNALDKLNTIVLTEQISHSLFGDENPIGKIILYNNKLELLVTGIAKEAPYNSSIQYDAIVSFSTLYTDTTKFMGWNGGNAYHGFVKIAKSTDIEKLEKDFKSLVDQKLNYYYLASGWYFSYHLEPIGKMHFRTDIGGEIGKKGNRNILMIFSSIALLILALATINYINLTTAKAGKRTVETGIRKTIGADKKDLILQFLGESVLYVFLAWIVAIVVVEITLTYVNHLLESKLSLYSRDNLKFILLSPVFILLNGILAGSYPSFYLSAFKPIQILKEGRNKFLSGSGFRNSLVVFQFFISITLIISMLTISRQLRFLRNYNTGYNKENIMVISLRDEADMKNYQNIKTELKNIPGVISAGASSDVPGKGFTKNGYIPEGSNSPKLFFVLDVDFDYMEVMGLKIEKGRFFSDKFSTDLTTNILVNDRLGKDLNWENPLGKQLHRDGIDNTIIGVVKDFNFGSLHDKIDPLIITMRPYVGYEYLSIRIAPGKLDEIIPVIHEIFQKTNPEGLFDYHFLDDEFEYIYKTELRFGKLSVYLAVLALSIALAGLFGLSSFVTLQKTKEIGICKAMGGTTLQIFYILISGFTQWVIIANLIAWPVAWYTTRLWLENFAYHVPVSIWPFILTGFLSILISVVTVGFQALKTASMNPSKSLHYE